MLRSKVTINGIMLRIMMNEFRGTMEVSLSDRLNLARVDRLLAEAEGEMAGKVMVEMTGEVTGTKEEEIGMIGGMMIEGRTGTVRFVDFIGRVSGGEFEFQVKFVKKIVKKHEELTIYNVREKRIL